MTIDHKTFAESLPRTPLAAWAATNVPGEKMLWRGAALHQVEAFANLAEEMNASAYVISTHRSKSISLPVVVFTFGGGLALAVVRDNFYDHKVTVLADDPVALDRAVDGPEPVHEVYCEGFPDGLVCGMYRDNRRAFTIETNREGLREIFGALARHVGSGVRELRQQAADTAAAG